MIIGVPDETAENETRAALSPPVAESLLDRGFDLVLSSGIGTGAGWSDAAYESIGCEVLDDRSDVFEQADVIFQVRGLGASPDVDIDPYRDGQTVIGLLGPYNLDSELDTLADRNVTAFALELIPRISRAQSMDALSSMASIGGYKAAITAAEALPKMFPMQMTAAGTVRPAELFVVGAGVAGLQAIATAQRLGANVRAYDIRPEVKEEVESLGAEFVELDLESEDASDEEGHAREQDEEFYEKQRQMMTRVVAESDVVITTAAIPGRPSPELVTNEMIMEMEPGSVIVDLAAEGGGNCEPTVADEVVNYEGVKIFGPTNLPGTVARHASELYSNNLQNFLNNLLDDDNNLNIDTSDEIIDSTLLTHEGKIHYGEDEPKDDSEDDETGDENE